MDDFRAEVGDTGAVCAMGGGTRWSLGGEPGEDVRVVAAPSGLDGHDPAEMTVSVWAGTPLTELQEALAGSGQEVALEGPEGSTVGGSLAVGRDSLRRLRIGTARDTLLQAECVGSDGAVFRSGGPTVKNVTGYELCRLLVGSLGTLALIGRVILRTRPLPECTEWLSGGLSPAEVLSSCYRPASVLWDGSSTHVRLEGYEADVARQAARLTDNGMEGASGGPDVPPHRTPWTGHLPDGGILEAPVGVVHVTAEPPPPEVDPVVRSLGERVRVSFDPSGRLNPGRDPYLVPG